MFKKTRMQSVVSSHQFCLRVTYLTYLYCHVSLQKFSKHRVITLCHHCIDYYSLILENLMTLE